jgi:hypothetical protein
MVDAEGASVDLRGPRHDKLLQQRLQTIVLNRFSEVDPRLHCRGTGSEGVQSWRHRHLLSGFRRHDEFNLPYGTWAEFFSAKQ